MMRGLAWMCIAIGRLHPCDVNRATIAGTSAASSTSFAQNACHGEIHKALGADFTRYGSTALAFDVRNPSGRGGFRILA